MDNLWGYIATSLFTLISFISVYKYYLSPILNDEILSNEVINNIHVISNLKSELAFVYTSIIQITTETRMYSFFSIGITAYIIDKLSNIGKDYIIIIPLIILAIFLIYFSILSRKKEKGLIEKKILIIDRIEELDKKEKMRKDEIKTA